MNRTHARILAQAAKAAYDDRPVTQLSPGEIRVWQEVQARFHASGRSADNLEPSLTLLWLRRQAGTVDLAFAASASCVLLCDPEIGALDRASESCDVLAQAAQELPPGRRRREMLAGAERHRATIARRRGRPDQALQFDRRAWQGSDHPRDLANVLIDLLRDKREGDARQLYLETQLTRDGSYVAALDQIIFDDSDLALLAPLAGEEDPA